TRPDGGGEDLPGRGSEAQSRARVADPGFGLDLDETGLALALQRDEVGVDVHDVVLAVPLARVVLPHAGALEPALDAGHEPRLLVTRVVPERVRVPIRHVR